MPLHVISQIIKHLYEQDSSDRVLRTGLIPAVAGLKGIFFNLCIVSAHGTQLVTFLIFIPVALIWLYRIRRHPTPQFSDHTSNYTRQILYLCFAALEMGCRALAMITENETKIIFTVADLTGWRRWVIHSLLMLYAMAALLYVYPGRVKGGLRAMVGRGSGEFDGHRVESGHEMKGREGGKQHTGVTGV